MALRPGSTSGKDQTEEAFIQAIVDAYTDGGDLQAEIDLAQSDAEATAAADLDAHLAGPPTGGALSVAEIDRLDAVAQEAWTATKVTRVGDLSDMSAAGVVKLVALGDENTLKEGDAAGAVALRLGATATEGWEIKVLDETVDLTTPAASHDLSINMPSPAVILSAQVNLETAVTGGTGATDVSLGISGTENKYGTTTNLTQNQKIDTIPDWAVLAGEDILLYATASGVATGTIGGASESVRVRIVYATLNSLDDTA